jgi:HEAT repeat protein
MERVRPLVEAIWKDVRNPGEDVVSRPRYSWTSEKLIAIGPDVLPFLISEIDVADPATFHYCAYSLGRLGGKDAEAALRRTVRAADVRGDNFGYACKRFAVFGLALLGAPDVMDMMQAGPKTLWGAQMIPDFPVAAHMAMLVGPPAAPLLDRQLETYANDPKSVEKLENTLLALSYVRDASLLPKLMPLLSSTSPRIRVQAADTISRLAEPSYCEKLLPLLAAKDVRERSLVAGSFARWKPEPCYKAIIGRLEVEDDIAVRGAYYRTIASMGGEASLDVFRANLGSGNEFDQAVVIKSIADIGSKKGLNMLRQVLLSPDPLTVVRALEAISAIGGEGAMDTLLAATAERRRAIAASAREILADHGVKKVAPRIAEDLLSMVREPVGNRALIVPISERTEALVKLDYVEPIEDLKKAAAVQTETEVAASLNSCVERLQLIRKNGDDAAAWAAESGSAVVPVRRLADRRLAEIGSPAAVKVLAARLAKTDITAEERADILMAIGNAHTTGAADLVERHLADPAYDPWDFHDARSAAAWAARRIGGERMTRALRESAVRRDGRDWATLAYLAVVDKADAIPTLKTLRLKRLRFPEAHFGREETLLELMILDLAAGRSPSKFDVPPETPRSSQLRRSQAEARAPWAPLSDAARTRRRGRRG